MIKKKNWVDKGTVFAGDCKKVYTAEENSSMSETTAAYAERTKRSLKNVLYRYMEDHGYKYIQNFSQIVTTLNSRENRTKDLIPKNIKDSDFLSVLYSKPLREFRKPKFKIGDRVRISKLTYTSERVISHSLH